MMSTDRNERDLDILGTGDLLAFEADTDGKGVLIVKLADGKRLTTLNQWQALTVAYRLLDFYRRSVSDEKRREAKGQTDATICAAILGG